LVPPIILLALAQFGLRPVLEDLWVSILPFFAAPPSYDAGEIRGSPEVQAQLAGAWWLWGLFLFMAVFNDFLGEEFLFPGVLLPKMKGVFGKWDWVANGVLFGAYHVHHPWGILGTIVILMFLGSFPARRFRSTWMSVIVHSADGVFPLFIILGLVLGLAQRFVNHGETGGPLDRWWIPSRDEQEGEKNGFQEPSTYDHRFNPCTDDLGAGSLRRWGQVAGLRPGSWSSRADPFSEQEGDRTAEEFWPRRYPENP